MKHLFFIYRKYRHQKPLFLTEFCCENKLFSGKLLCFQKAILLQKITVFTKINLLAENYFVSRKLLCSGKLLCLQKVTLFKESYFVYRKLLCLQIVTLFTESYCFFRRLLVLLPKMTCCYIPRPPWCWWLLPGWPAGRCSPSSGPGSSAHPSPDIAGGDAYMRHTQRVLSTDISSRVCLVQYWEPQSPDSGKKNFKITIEKMQKLVISCNLLMC